MTVEELQEKRELVKSKVPTKCIPSVILHTRLMRCKSHRDQLRTHNKKLQNLSYDQERPLFNVQNTVVLCGLDAPPPAYVQETLSLGPKNAVLDRFDSKNVLAEVDGLLHFCAEKQISDDVITDINVKTLNYINAD